MNKLVIPAVAAFALMAASASAQQQQMDAGQRAPESGQHELIGMEVVSQGGEELGQIQNVLIDKEGKVEAVILERGGGVLGMGGETVAVKFDRLQLPEADPSIPSDEQQAQIDMTQEQLGELPEFESTRGERGGEEPSMQQEPSAQPGTTGTPGTAPGQQRE